MLREAIAHNQNAAAALQKALRVTANDQPELHGILSGAMGHIRNQEFHLNFAQAMMDEQKAAEANQAAPAPTPGLFSRITRVVFGK